MAQLTAPPSLFGADTSAVDETAKHVLGTRAFDTEGREWIYLKGVASTVAGSWVTFDDTGATALLAANAVGPVAVAGAATVANTYGWYCIHSGATTVTARVAANTADNAQLGREGADGVAGDGRSAGDQIIGAVARAAVGASDDDAPVQIWYPQVNDATGS